jgi:hypothetical protein
MRTWRELAVRRQVALVEPHLMRCLAAAVREQRATQLVAALPPEAFEATQLASTRPNTASNNRQPVDLIC